MLPLQARHQRVVPVELSHDPHRFDPGGVSEHRVIELILQVLSRHAKQSRRGYIFIGTETRTNRRASLRHAAPASREGQFFHKPKKTTPTPYQNFDSCGEKNRQISSLIDMIGYLKNHHVNLNLTRFLCFIRYRVY